MKKFNQLLNLLVFCALSSNLYAQEIKTYEGMMNAADIPLKKEMNIGGSFNVTYEYYENEDGSRVRHGKFVVGQSSNQIAIGQLEAFYSALDEVAKSEPVTPEYVITDKNGNRVAGVAKNITAKPQLDLLGGLKDGIRFQLVGVYEHGKKNGVWIYRESHSSKLHIATFVDDKYNGEYYYFPNSNKAFTEENAVKLFVTDNVVTEVVSYPKGDSEIIQIGGVDSEGAFSGVWKWRDHNGFSTPRVYSAEFVRGIPIWMKYINDSTGELVDDMTPLSEDVVEWIRKEYTPGGQIDRKLSAIYKIENCYPQNNLSNGWNLRPLANNWYNICRFIPGSTRIYTMKFDAKAAAAAEKAKEIAAASKARAQRAQELKETKGMLNDLLKEKGSLQSLYDHTYVKNPKLKLHDKTKSMVGDMWRTSRDIDFDITALKDVTTKDELTQRIEKLSDNVTLIINTLNLPQPQQKQINKAMPKEATTEEMIVFLKGALNTLNSGGKL